MKRTQIIISILFALMMFVVIVSSTTMDHPTDVARLQLPLQTVPQAVGIFVSAAASLALLLKTLGGADMERLAPFVMPLFAGLLLIQVHWTLAVALGLIALGLVIRLNLQVFAGRRTADAAERGKASQDV